MRSAGGTSLAFPFAVAAVVTVTVAATAMRTPIADDGGDIYPVESFRALGNVVLESNKVVDEGKMIRPIHLPFLQNEGEVRRLGASGSWHFDAFDGGAQVWYDMDREDSHPARARTVWQLDKYMSRLKAKERVTEGTVIMLDCLFPPGILYSLISWFEITHAEVTKRCKMGGLKVIPNEPDPSYVWEMLHADTGELILHFDGKIKHTIPGLEVGDDCNPRGHMHSRAFGTVSPCRSHYMVTRESIEQCMPIKSEQCLQRMPSRDPAVRRTIVVFRDPRDIVISERRMRITVFNPRHQDIPLVSFINRRFKRIVSWQLVRWIWHTTVYENESYVMLYEDLQASPEALIDLAAFMGLKCSQEQALDVWEKHRNRSPHGKFDEYGIPVETIEFMNATMLELLPKELLYRYMPTLISH